MGPAMERHTIQKTSTAALADAATGENIMKPTGSEPPLRRVFRVILHHLAIRIQIAAHGVVALPFNSLTTENAQIMLSVRACILKILIFTAVNAAHVVPISA